MIHFNKKTFRVLFIVFVVCITNLSCYRESVRDRNAQIGHLRKVGSLSTQNSFSSPLRLRPFLRQRNKQTYSFLIPFKLKIIHHQKQTKNKIKFGHFNFLHFSPFFSIQFQFFYYIFKGTQTLFLQRNFQIKTSR